MKPLFTSFGLFIRQITTDNMLWAVCFAPILTALLFRFGLTYAETMLCGYFQKQTILADYYLLFDLWMCLMPSYMLCFASAMVILTERDENMASYMAVTPVGKTGYMISRLIFPAAIGLVYSILLTYIFSLMDWNLVLLSAVSLLLSLSSTAANFLIISFSRNKVEGMAMAKIASLIFLGMVVPFFILSDAQYFAAFLPSFWTAKLSMDKNSLFMIPALLVSFAWIIMLSRRFNRKLY